MLTRCAISEESVGPFGRYIHLSKNFHVCRQRRMVVVGKEGKSGGRIRHNERRYQPRPDDLTKALETRRKIRSLSFPNPTMSNDTARSNTAVPQKRSLDVAQSSNNTRQRLVKVTRACDVCKAKKSKCSGDQPCESCVRRGLTCQYEAVYLRGKVPSPRPSGTAASSPQRTTSVPAYPHAILGVAPSMAVGGNHPADEEVEPPSRASPGLEVAGQYSDSTSGLSFLHRAWRRISNKESSQFVNGSGSTEDRQLLMSAGDKPFLETGQVQMPSLDRSRQLLHLYFDVCIATYRLLHRPTVESWLETVSENAKLHRALFHGVYNCRRRQLAFYLQRFSTQTSAAQKLQWFYLY
jgi:hypothetical protein